MLSSTEQSVRLDLVHPVTLQIYRSEREKIEDGHQAVVARPRAFAAPSLPSPLPMNAFLLASLTRFADAKWAVSKNKKGGGCMVM